MHVMSMAYIMMKYLCMSCHNIDMHVMSMHVYGMIHNRCYILHYMHIYIIMTLHAQIFHVYGIHYEDMHVIPMVYMKYIDISCIPQALHAYLYYDDIHEISDMYIRQYMTRYFMYVYQIVYDRPISHVYHHNIDMHVMPMVYTKYEISMVIYYLIHMKHLYM